MGKSRGLLNNANWSIVSIIVTVLGAFVSMPIIINALGANNYGLFTIILMIGGFAALQDFGLGEATLRFVAMYHAKNDILGINRVVRSSLFLYIIILLIVFSVLQIFAYQIINLFELEVDQIEIGIQALRIAALSFFIITIAEALQKIPEALLRYDITSKVNLLIVFIRFSSMILVVKLGYGIIGLTYIIVFVSVLKLVIYSYISTSMVDGLIILPKYDKVGLKEVFSFSIYSFLNQIISQIANYVDRIVLGIFFSTSDVAYLAAPKDITSRSSALVGAAGKVLFPKFSSMKDESAMQKLYVNSLWALTTFSLVLLIPLSVVFPDFLTLWISEEFAKNSGQFAQLYALGFAFTGGVTVYFTLLKGTGRMKMLTSIVSSLTIISTIATALLVYKYGLIGSAIRTLVFSWIGITVCIVVGKKVFRNISTLPFVLENAILPLIVGGGIYCVSTMLFQYLIINNWLMLVTVYIVLAIIILFFSIILNSVFLGKKGTYQSFVKSLKQKIC